MLSELCKPLSIVARLSLLEAMPANPVQNKTIPMKTTKLISGQFTSAEAREVLLDMIDSKINFHKIKSLSSLVRNHQPNRESELRIKELKEARDQIITLIETAKEQESTLRIESSLCVSLETNELVEEDCPKTKDC